MIIKKLNLLSFGKFKNKEITLSDHLNIIYGTNESGKSTISAFIEAMLYSYPPRDENRTKYFPWDNSLPSGIMDIYCNGKTHTIYRSFGQTPKSDTLKIEPELNLSEVFPDREAFRKSVYCPEGKAGDFDKTAGMDARIANIMASGDENVNAQSAVEYLTEQKKRYVKQRGNTGLLQKTYSLVTDLENELTIARICEDDLKSSRMEILNKKKAIASYKESIASFEKDVESFNIEDNELEESIASQKEYISNLTPPSPTLGKVKKSRFLPIIYIICSLFLAIIAFLFYMPLLLLAPLPILGYFIHRLIKGKSKKSSDCTPSDNDYVSALADLDMLREKKALITDKISSLRQEIADLQKSIIADREEVYELEKRLAENSGRAIDEIEAELNYTKSLAREMEKKVNAIDAAIDAINHAAKRFGEDFTPAVTKKAGEYLALIAPKETRNVTLVLSSEKKKALALSVTDPLPRDFSAFSYGFRQEVYIAFRLALSEFLYGDELPVIIDDPFLGSDDYREKRLIELLCSIAKTRQVIIFTNRKNDYFNQLACNFIDIRQ